MQTSVDDDHPRSIRVLEEAGLRLAREEHDEQGRLRNHEVRLDAR